jgi:uncharacterized protein (DUF3084 family)
MKTILETRKANAKKRNIASRESSLQKYEEKQAEIEKLLKQITVGLQAHDRRASGQDGHHWGHVGDLNKIAGDLRDISDRLHGTGEYAKG